MQFKSLIECLEYFKEEQTCISYLIHQRWEGKPECPFCGCIKAYTIEGGKRFKCADRFCNKKFSVTVGTMFENTKIPLKVWFAAIYLSTSSKKGVSSLQLGRQLNITQKTAWFVLHRIREMMKEKAPEMLSGTIEMDEVYMGGKNQNRHVKHRLPRKQRGKTEQKRVSDKTPVFGVLERNGKVHTFVLPIVNGETVRAIVEKIVVGGSSVVTDEHYMYKPLRERYMHTSIDHSLNQFVAPNKLHTNTIEGFWSLLRRSIYGIYHQVSVKHLQRYCNEIGSKYNSRKFTDATRFNLTLKNSEGRLKYAQLIAKPIV